jgi:thiol:disulfide interchange protein DsbD
MMVYFRLLLCLFGLWAVPAWSVAAADAGHVRVNLIAEEQTIEPGKSFWVALHVQIEKGWHVYWKNPGDAGMPLKLNWKLPDGFQTGTLQWPFPEKFTFDDMVGFGYHDEVMLLAQLVAPQSISSTKTIDLQGSVSWLVCSSETCQPGSAPVKLTLNVGSAQPNPAVSAIFEKARAKMPKSQVEVKTIQKSGVIQLQLPTHAAQDAVTGIYFFPEEQNVIDASIDPVIVTNQNESNGYLVNLKGGAQVGAKTTNLKGVLVVETQADGVQAFDIDSPIHEDSEEEFLSFFDAKTAAPSVIGDSALKSKTPEFEGGLGLALLFAFLGGMLLNLMPCVLPVMSFKVMGFVKMAGQSRALTIKHGLLFSLGVVLSFWILAGVMLMLRTYGQAVGWGFQLQEPLFVVILASLLFIFALSLFGVFELGLVMASWAGQTEAEAKQKTSGNMTSFFSGVMATAVATPCTGPFLGSAIGFAVTLPVMQALSIFTTLGLGMCFPYLLLAAFPSFLRFMPKPGPWMETFKQLMGFLLLATVLWLMWVFSAQTNSLSLILLLAGFLCFSMGAWLYGRGSSPLVTKPKRILAYAFVTLFIVAGCQLILMPRASWYSEVGVADHKGDWQGWETFSPERVAQLQQQGTPFLIDFTAKWCLICQTNHMVLSSDQVDQQLNAAGVVKLKADWTKSDPVITEALSQFGRNSVPLYVLYTGKEEPVILPQVLTPDAVLEHLVNPDEVALKE